MFISVTLAVALFSPCGVIAGHCSDWLQNLDGLLNLALSRLMWNKTWRYFSL